MTDLVIYPSEVTEAQVEHAVTELGGEIVTRGMDTYLARWPKATTLEKLTTYRDQLRKDGLTVEFTVVFPTAPMG